MTGLKRWNCKRGNKMAGLKWGHKNGGIEKALLYCKGAINNGKIEKAP